MALSDGILVYIGPSSRGKDKREKKILKTQPARTASKVDTGTHRHYRETSSREMKQQQNRWATLLSFPVPGMGGGEEV